MAISWYDGNGRLLSDFVVGYICVITPSNQEWFFWKPNIRTFLSCNFSFRVLILPAWFAKRGSVFTKQMVFTVQWESCSDYGAIEGPYYYPLSTFFDAAKPKYPWSLSSDETGEKTREGVPCASGVCVCGWSDCVFWREARSSFLNIFATAVFNTKKTLIVQIIGMEWTGGARWYRTQHTRNGLWEVEFTNT